MRQSQQFQVGTFFALYRLVVEWFGGETTEIRIPER